MQIFPPQNDSDVVDYRRTFARWHVEQELQRTDDVLAVEAIKAKGNDAWRKAKRDPDAFETKFRAACTLDDFLYSSLPDLEVYLRVPVFAVEDPQDSYADLTHLILESTQQHGSRPGVVLVARSGSGKTLAGRKAFFDCFCGPRPLREGGGGKPALAGYLPVWVKVNAQTPTIKGIKNAALKDGILEVSLRHVTPDVVLELLGSTVDFRSASTSTIERWLCHGPKVLLFFDLNKAGLDERLIIAQALGTFQGEFANRGHRVVVAYRSTVADDAAMARLKQSGAFGFYDQKPLSTEAAVKYLRHIREFEARVFQDIDPSLTQSDVEADRRKPDIEADCRKLEELVRRPAQSGESLISTPLLMHWVTVLTGSKLDEVETLTDLYDRVVVNHILRDQDNPAMPASLSGRNGQRRMLNAMTRLALAMLPDVRHTTRLRIDRVEELLVRPPEFRKTNPSWWPADGFWDQSPYYRDSFDEDNEVDPVLEFSLLRREGAWVGFIHDSLIHYFAGAMALPFHRTPLLPTPEVRKGHVFAAEWFPKIAARLCTDTSSWEQPAEFLGGSLLGKSGPRGMAAKLESLIYEHLFYQPLASSCTAEAWSKQFELGGLVERLERVLPAGARSWPEALWAKRQAAVRDLKPDLSEDQRALLAATARRLERGTGLVALGADPVTGLWEFADPRTGTMPERVAVGRLVLHDDFALVLVLLPAGGFVMGSPGSEEGRDNEKPQRRIQLEPFLLSKYPLTQAQWERMGGRHQPHFRGPRLPVESVTWHECRQVLSRRGYALPVEAQWEYACRAGTTGPFGGTGKLVEMGWYCVNSGDEAHPVGQLLPNHFGLHDLHGNVSEWCEDAYSSLEYRRVRGGCWNEVPWSCRSARRGGLRRSLRDDNLGCRPSRPLQ